MQLTQKQESLITRYLRDVAMRFDADVPDKARERGLKHVQKQVNRKLASLSKASIEDTDVMAVLESLGPPEIHSQVLPTEAFSAQGLVLCRDNRIWLGVCAGVGARIGQEPWLMRIAAFVAGLCTGPFALLVYIALYAVMRFSTPKPLRSPLKPLRLLTRSVGTIIAAVLLHVGSLYAVQLIYLAHVEYLKRELPGLDEWNWVELRADEMLFWVLAVCLPFAILSGLPLANAWDHSLKRLVQSILSLYGIALAFGIASILVGLILHHVNEVGGLSFLQ